MKTNSRLDAGRFGLVLILTLTTPGVAATYSLQDLGVLTNLSGRSDSRLNAISGDGKVAAANVTNGAYRAFLYNGVWLNLDTLGGNESLSADVNNAGLVVGYSQTISGTTQAFVWTPGGTDGVPANPQMKALGTLGGTHSEAYAINAIGQITGYSQTGSDDHAFVYTSGVMTDIGMLLGNSLPNSYGLGINDAGHVAGIAYNSSFSTAHAFLFNGVTAVDIGTLGGASASALAINNSDHLAGYSSDTNGFEHAFRYANGVMTDLGTLGGNYSYGIGINNSNTVVGGSFVDSGDNIYHAFIAVNNSMVDLNTQLDATGAGWTLTEARAINDAGQIVGTGTFGGANRAFLLSPLPAAPVTTITGVQVSAGDILVSFTTIAAATYAVEARIHLATGNWDQLIGGIPGTGAVITITNAGAASLPQQFYRVRAVVP